MKSYYRWVIKIIPCVRNITLWTERWFLSSDAQNILRRSGWYHCITLMNPAGGKKVLEIYYLAMRVTRIIWVRFLHKENNKLTLGVFCVVSVLAEMLDLHLLMLGINIKPSRRVAPISFDPRVARKCALLTGKFKFPAKVGYSERGRFYSTSKACISNTKKNRGGSE